MNSAGMFAPDINFTPARNLYPTSPGGTTASAGGGVSAQSNTVIVDPGTGTASPTVAASPTPTINTRGQSVYWWLGIVVFLAAMVMVARKAGGEEDFRNIRPTAYNFLTITLTSIVGIVALKVVASKYRVPGASDVILAA